MRKIERFMMTNGFNAKYGVIETTLYVSMVKQLWKKHPIDMFIFETHDGIMTVSVNGYHVETGKYVETTPIATFASLPVEKFWLKIDDYGDDGGLIGTFLFPDEY